MKEVKAQRIELATDRLIIRSPQERDVHDIFVLMSDREIAAITGFRPMGTLSEAEGKMKRFSVFLKSPHTRQIPCRAKNAITRYVIFFIKRLVGKAI